jgi:hypothetical protein
MAAALTFIIPVRHQDNAKDWPRLKSNLAQTLRSLSGQTCSDWRAIVVANHGADLPSLPPQVEVKWVDFPPNQLHEQGEAGREAFYDACRINKGERVLAGMLHARAMRYAMVVDDDDCVSSRLAEFVAAQPDVPGWYVQDGYLWEDGSRYLYRYSGFSKLCGTSHIVRADLFALPASLEQADTDYIRTMMGSHIFIDSYLRERGTPLAPLPFDGAVYRVGHPGAHSKSQGVFTQYFMHRWLLRSPGELARRLARLKYLSRGLRREYFGERPATASTAC